MMVHAMNCDAFDERLSDYLEGELAPADRRAVEAHLASCLRCTALVRDIEAIRADATVLPELVPTRDLWDGIASRIEAPVVPLLPHGAPIRSYPRRQFHRLRFAAAAAALVAVTAGATYLLTMARVSSSSDSVLVANQQVGSQSPGDTGAKASEASTTYPVSPVDTTVADPAEELRPPVSAQNVGDTGVSSSPSREIDRLRQIFIQNRNRLDPRTAAIIEANLKVIDDAIAQSRAALAQDPASEFLNEQVKSAVDKKLELLRTAARLPQRT